MTTIQSNHKLINKSCDKIFIFLSNMNNFQKLMPSKVNNWRSSENACYFNFQGLGDFGMKIIKTEKNKNIKLLSDGKVVFNFDLNIDILSLENNQSKVKFTYQADLNFMMKILAVQPLTKFTNGLIEQLENLKF